MGIPLCIATASPGTTSGKWTIGWKPLTSSMHLHFFTCFSFIWTHLYYRAFTVLPCVPAADLHFSHCRSLRRCPQRFLLSSPCMALKLPITLNHTTVSLSLYISHTACTSLLLQVVLPLYHCIFLDPHPFDLHPVYQQFSSNNCISGCMKAKLLLADRNLLPLPGATLGHGCTFLCTQIFSEGLVYTHRLKYADFEWQIISEESVFLIFNILVICPS